MHVASGAQLLRALVFGWGDTLGTPTKVMSVSEDMQEYEKQWPDKKVKVFVSAVAGSSDVAGNCHDCLPIASYEFQWHEKKIE
jgi:hypothetical protein